MKTQKRLAASLLKCGVKRIRVNPADEEVQMALTRDDIRAAIARKAIYKVKSNQQSRVRARKIKLARKKGRSSGHGRRKGPAGAREPSKQQWVRRIRAIRDELRKMKAEGKITPHEYRRLFRLSKAGVIHHRAHARSMGGK
ncbi:MAG: 50S ribosomal protein L19e [archaeon]